MNTDQLIGIAGIGVGIVSLGFAYWTWSDAKKKGDQLVTFLHGLKSCDIPPKALEQINDMLARLDPPHSRT